MGGSSKLKREFSMSIDILITTYRNPVILELNMNHVSIPPYMFPSVIYKNCSINKHMYNGLKIGMTFPLRHCLFCLLSVHNRSHHVFYLSINTGHILELNHEPIVKETLSHCTYSYFSWTDNPTLIKLQ